MSDRRIDGFFYGLFMDQGTLRDAGVAPLNPRRAYVEDFALRIGQRATLIPSPGARVYGMLFGLTHSEFDRLYAAPGLGRYRPEALRPARRERVVRAWFGASGKPQRRL